MSRLSIKCCQVFLSLLAITVPCFAQYHGLDPALDKAAKEYDRAQIVGDRAALQRLVADDYLLMRGNGTVVGKAQLIDLVAHDGLKTDPYVVQKPFSRKYGEVVILGGWVHLSGSDHGQPFVQNARFADTWARRKSQWFVVFTSVVLTDRP
ncbi:nuclear transport factor 2 family protein [Edaphobacter albus]|uniref:nuclear transport factor 2 family protein n=1 Tax=Edaphobacter sp. 4G125 TaxID=2763071 RepID=UPI00164774F5|nr:nuclear transport factor 2 family protein [Edaphobacter sp. 4G125]QNI36287.1 nuclear transport factor 2 family protein [Edaphobacter sp. 4G125]